MIADKAKKSKPDQKKSDSTQTTQEKSPTKNSKPDPRIQNALAKINEDLKNEGGGGGGAGQSSGGSIGGAGGNSNGGGNSECGAYKARVKNIILGNWKRVTLASKPERPPKLSFRVTGAGQVTSVKWMQRSGDQVLDASAQRAVESSRTIPSPPANCQAALEESFVVQFGR